MDNYIKRNLCLWNPDKIAEINKARLLIIRHNDHIIVILHGQEYDNADIAIDVVREAEGIIRQHHATLQETKFELSWKVDYDIGIQLAKKFQMP